MLAYGISEQSIVVPTLDTVMPGILNVGPARGQIPDAVEFRVDGRTIAWDR